MMQEKLCKQFAEMHLEDEAWVIPNPWDLGTAKMLQGLGFRAIATTSSGFAFSLGRADGEVSLDEKLAHCSGLSRAVSIPVNADFENGFSDSIAQMQENIKRVIETGVAGLSIEDYSRDHKTLYSLNESVDRINSAREAINATGIPVVLTARAENLIRGVDDVENTIQRLQAYSSAADVLYAPGVRSLESLKAVTSQIEKPFNVLGVFLPDATLSELSNAGAARVSVGGALCWSTLAKFVSLGKLMGGDGSFAWSKEMIPSSEVRKLLDQ